MPRELPVMSACFPFCAMAPPGRAVAAKDARRTPRCNYSGIVCAVGIAHRVGFDDAAALLHEIRKRRPLDRESEAMLLRQGFGRDVDHQLQLAGGVGGKDQWGQSHTKTPAVRSA